MRWRWPTFRLTVGTVFVIALIVFLQLDIFNTYLGHRVPNVAISPRRVIESAAQKIFEVVDPESQFEDSVCTDNVTTIRGSIHASWLETVEQYYQYKVKSIMSLSVKYLSLHPELNFIWSEISFLARWWQDATEEQKTTFKKLQAEGRLEVTGGAWVMTDEATPLFWSSIDNLVEGHSFLKETLGVVPNTSWSVDPFGHGLMVPYLLPMAGIDHMVIGRIHNAHKQRMRAARKMRFNWAQVWDTKSEVRPFVNVLPFLYYTTVNACGPDEEICCRYHVGPSNRWGCNERADKNMLTEQDVERYAVELVRQYRKLQLYYDTQNVLVAVGDDFYLGFDGDWTETLRIYSRIFNFINEHKERFNATFSTVSKFFAALEAEEKPVEVLTGDFFPYTENPTKPNPWWTGFYAHRPYHKRFERIIQSKLRAHDLMRTLFTLGPPSKNITIARRNLALFQHHDAITGTSKKHVMADYLMRLETGLEWIEDELSAVATKVLIPKEGETAPFSTIESEPTDKSAEELPLKLINLTSTAPITVTIWSQLEIPLVQMVTILVDKIKVAVYDTEGVPIPSQVMPYFTTKGALVRDAYRLVFFYELKPLSLTSFQVKVTENTAKTSVAEVRSNYEIQASLFTVSIDLVIDELSVATKEYRFRGNLSESFLLIEPLYSENASKIKMFFSKIRDTGGAYVIQTAGNLTRLSFPKETVKAAVISGSLYTEIRVHLSPLIGFVITLETAAYGSKTGNSVTPSFGVTLLPDAANMEGETLFVHFETNIKNPERTFYTDVNGMYMTKRIDVEKAQFGPQGKLPFEASVYPMSVCATIQDSDSRMTIFAGQSTGAHIGAQGELLVIVDRRLQGDDGKGLGVGDASESRPGEPKLRILIEKISRQGGPGDYDSDEKKGGEFVYHSADAHFTQEKFLYGPTVFFTQGTGIGSVDMSLHWSCSIQLVNLRYLDRSAMLLTLRRLPYDCLVKRRIKCDDDLRETWRLVSGIGKKVVATSLTGTADKETVNEESFTQLLKSPLHIRTFKILLV